MVEFRLLELSLGQPRHVPNLDLTYLCTFIPYNEAVVPGLHFHSSRTLIHMVTLIMLFLPSIDVQARKYGTQLHAANAKMQVSARVFEIREHLPALPQAGRAT